MRLSILFKNIRFRNKIMLISFFIGLFPILLLGTFSYYQMKKHLIERETIALQETLSSEIQNLDYQLNSILDAMNVIVWNESIRSALSQNYTTNYEMYLAYRDVIDPLCFTIRNMNQALASITIYSDGTLYPHGDILRPLSEAEDTYWYQKNGYDTSPSFILSPDESTLYLTCQIFYYHSPYKHIICFTLDKDMVFSSISELFDSSYGAVLISMDNQENASFEILEEYTTFDDPDFIIPLDSLQNANSFPDLQKQYVIEKQSLTSVPWDLYLYRSLKTVSKAANQISILVLIMVFISLLIIFCSSLLLSKVIVKPIDDLSDNMTLIEQDNYAIT